MTAAARKKPAKKRAGKRKLDAITNDWRQLAEDAIKAFRGVANEIDPDLDDGLRARALRGVSGLEKRLHTLAGQLELFAVALLVLVALAACGDNVGPDVHTLPDAAAIDAAVDATPDACVREPSGDCCTLLPDENAVRACAAQGLNPGDCGVAVCWMADCSRVTINFCVPDAPDGGV